MATILTLLFLTEPSLQDLNDVAYQSVFVAAVWPDSVMAFCCFAATSAPSRAC